MLSARRHFSSVNVLDGFCSLIVREQLNADSCRSNNTVTIHEDQTEIPSLLTIRM
jgi:hypothetical protein